MRIAFGLAVIVAMFVGFASAAPSGNWEQALPVHAPAPHSLTPASARAVAATGAEAGTPGPEAGTPGPEAGTPGAEADAGARTATARAVVAIASTTPEGPALPPRAQQTLAQIPVLMYHEIGDKPNNNYVDRDTFAAEMKWLADNGYQGVTLGEVYRHLHQQAEIAPKPVAITFDDGYASFYTTVIPILQQYGFHATNFVITGNLGHPEFMTWEQVSQLPKLGMEVGDHTVHHLDLRQVSPEKLKAEVLGAKSELEARLGVPVQFFCYPAGKYNDAVLSLLKESGFLAAVTTAYGPVTSKDDPLLWDRVRILRIDTVRSFDEKVKRASALVAN